MTSETGPAEKVRVIWLGLLLFALTALVYARAHSGDFGFVDIGDPTYVTANSNVQSGLSAASIRWALTTRHGDTWQPLTWISLQLDSGLFGTGPRGFHFTSCLLHALNTVLLFVVLWRLTGGLWCSAVVAGLFGLHPTHVESVAWVARRQDVLGVLFVLLTIASYGRYARRHTASRYLMVAAMSMLGLLSNPTFPALLILLFLLAYCPLRRWPDAEPGRFAPASFPRLLADKIPLIAIATIPFLIHLLSQSTPRLRIANLGFE